MAKKPVVKHIETIGGTKYFFTAIQAWVELVYAGHVPNYTISFTEGDRVAVAQDGNAILVWRNATDNTAYILIGWVAPRLRGKGWYTLLYNSVKQQAKKLGAKRIIGGIMPNNTNMINCAKKQGRKATAVWYEENL